MEQANEPIHPQDQHNSYSNVLSIQFLAILENYNAICKVDHHNIHFILHTLFNIIIKTSDYTTKSRSTQRFILLLILYLKVT